MQVASSPPLRPYIKHYLFLSNGAKEVKSFRLFTDGNMGLVVTLDGALALRESQATLSLPTSFVYGQLDGFKDLSVSSAQQYIIVVFQPTGIKQLLGIDALHLSAQMFDAEDILGTSFRVLKEQLLNAVSKEAQIAALNGYFERVLSRSIPRTEVANAAVSYIMKQLGQLTANELSCYLGYSERQVRRLFDEYVGISPSRFSAIVKLHNYLNLLKRGDATLTDAALEAGYYDQSHLNRVFKNMVGVKPYAYLYTHQKPTINLVDIEY